MPFRVQAKWLWLTYSQTPMSPKSVFEKLSSVLPNIKYAKIVQEKHKDGNLHVHALVCLAAAVRTSDARFVDLDGIHPNLSTLRYPVQLREKSKYMDKAPLDTFVFGALTDIIPEEKIPVKDQISRLLKQGTSLTEILKSDQHSGFLMMNYQKIHLYEKALIQLKSFNPLPWTRINFNMNPEASSICYWMANNLFDTRPLKQKQLYIWSHKPNMGKTTLIDYLQKRMKVYLAPIGEKYVDDLTNDHDLIVFDEFCGTIQLGIMNQILDGQTCTLPQRYKCLLKTKNMPVIILANVPPECIYVNDKIQPARINAFLARLQVIEVTQFINIFQ